MTLTDPTSVVHDPRTRRTRYLVLALCCVLAAGFWSPAAAQVVRGTLVDDREGNPLPRATVTLLDENLATADSTRTSATGAFTLRAPRAGSYMLYFAHPGYASVPSNWLRLDAGQTLEHRFDVPLISGTAISRMSETINLEERLQGSLSEICGEPVRAWEAGLVVGVVRRRGGQPLAGAIVTAEAPARDGAPPFRKATVTSANGVYVICNVPAGAATTRTELAGYRTDQGPVEVRAGTVAWYDVSLRPR